MKTLKFLKALAYSIGRYIWLSITRPSYKKTCWCCKQDFVTLDKRQIFCIDCELE